MVRWAPSLAFSAASLHLAALASYFSALLWRSFMTLLPLRVPHTTGGQRVMPTRSKRWQGLGDFAASKAARIALHADWQSREKRRDSSGQLSYRPARGISCLSRLVLQATPRSIDLGIGRTMAACIGLRCGRRILRHIEANQAAGHPLHGTGLRRQIEKGNGQAQRAGAEYAA